MQHLANGSFPPSALLILFMPLGHRIVVSCSDSEEDVRGILVQLSCRRL